jgi:hypothetical protein
VRFPGGEGYKGLLDLAGRRSETRKGSWVSGRTLQRDVVLLWEIWTLLCLQAEDWASVGPRWRICTPGVFGVSQETKLPEMVLVTEAGRVKGTPKVSRELEPWKRGLP